MDPDWYFYIYPVDISSFFFFKLTREIWAVTTIHTLWTSRPIYLIPYKKPKLLL